MTHAKSEDNLRFCSTWAELNRALDSKLDILFYSPSSDVTRSDVETAVEKTEKKVMLIPNNALVIEAITKMIDNSSEMQIDTSDLLLFCRLGQKVQYYRFTDIDSVLTLLEVHDIEGVLLQITYGSNLLLVQYNNIVTPLHSVLPERAYLQVGLRTDPTMNTNDYYVDLFVFKYPNEGGQSMVAELIEVKLNDAYVKL